MTLRELRELHHRASALGIQTEFNDARGRRRVASVEALRALIELLRDDRPRRPSPLPPVIVCWGGKPKPVSLIAPGRSRTHWMAIKPTLHAEGGVAPPIRLKHAPRRSDVLHLPALPFGYYDLTIEIGGDEHRSLIISAPIKAYAPRNFRAWGVFAPMYAIHSRTSWGGGDFSDWQSLCESLEGRTPQDSDRTLGEKEPDIHGSRVSSIVATLPLLGAFLDDWKCEPSPYSPATRLFWNEFFLDITRVPGFSANRAVQRVVNSGAFQSALRNLSASDVVDYRTEMSLKRRILQILADAFFRSRSPRVREFEQFVKSRPELERYAAFRAACEQRCESWQAWPARMREGRLRHGDYDERVRRHFLFAQWLAQEQMDLILARCREHNMKFYLDLPLGVNPAGYDVWANQRLFVRNASVGAPPDAFFTKGQDWGFPPLHPERIRESGYRYVIDYLRFQMRHTGMLRLDHVMGLHRLWWVPADASAADGAYVRYNAEEWYAILCLESHRNQTMLVGENLGTVPPEVNRSMKRHGMRRMFVVQYELKPNVKRALRNPPRDCVASINTHDMPMWAAYWSGLDITDRQRLGLLKPPEAREERKRRARLRTALEKFLRQKKLLSTRADARSVLRALLAFLARSGAEVVLVNLEDLWLETQPQNTPGTSTERVNWKRKTKLALEEFLSRPDVASMFEALRR